MKEKNPILDSNVLIYATLDKNVLIYVTKFKQLFGINLKEIQINSMKVMH